MDAFFIQLLMPLIEAVSGKSFEWAIPIAFAFLMLMLSRASKFITNMRNQVLESNQVYLEGVLRSRTTDDETPYVNRVRNEIRRARTRAYQTAITIVAIQLVSIVILAYFALLINYRYTYVEGVSCYVPLPCGNLSIFTIDTVARGVAFDLMETFHLSVTNISYDTSLNPLSATVFLTRIASSLILLRTAVTLALSVYAFNQAIQNIIIGNFQWSGPVKHD